jgi:hypothetical protein
MVFCEKPLISLIFFRFRYLRQSSNDACANLTKPAAVTAKTNETMDKNKMNIFKDDFALN